MPRRRCGRRPPVPGGGGAGVLRALADVRGLQALGALLDLEVYALTLLQRTETIPADRGVVYEDILPVVPGDEAVALLRIEPLHFPLWHAALLFRLVRVDVAPVRNGPRLTQVGALGQGGWPEWARHYPRPGLG